jgi:biopolymer transport protein TolR
MQHKKGKPRALTRRDKGLHSAATKSEINVTPLVDVVLVLLIIFMVVTPMLHRSVAVELPETENHEKKQDTGEQLMLAVRADGMYVEATRLEGDALMDKLRQEVEQKPGRPVHLKGDRSLKYGAVRKMLDALEQVGAQQIGLGTDKRKE